MVNMELLCKDSKEFSVEEVQSVSDLFTLRGKKALITGGAGGIGRSTAKAFADLGADVALMDIPQKEDELKKICEQIQHSYHVDAIYVTGNVADEASVDKFVGQVTDHFGTIDILHNNAGIINPGDCADTPISAWKRLLDINLTGMLLVGRAVANVMIRDGHGGAIINTASMSAHIINKNKTEEYGFAYTTSKAAVLHLTHGMACQYIKYGIRVNSISPGVVISGIHDEVPASIMEFSATEVPIKRFGKLSEIAGAVAFLATDLAGFMVGTDILIDGGQCLN